MAVNEVPGLNQPVVVVDRNAGFEVGHHRHWFDLLVQALPPDVPVQVVNIADRPEEPSMSGRGRGSRGTARTQWYEAAVAAALERSPRAIVLTSGDDALPALWTLRHRLRASGVPILALMFRMAPQPRPRGIVTYTGKVAVISALTVHLPHLRLFGLELPVGSRRRIDVLLRLRSIVDSSAAEQEPGIGVTRARELAGLGQVEGPVVVTLGMLGPGKHVDTLVDAWRLGSIPGGRLVLAGATEPGTDDLLRDAAALDPSIDYRPGRLSDEEFSALLEAADVVCAVYRYSASSGVALRALALGRRVLIGGSAMPARSLGETPGVTVVKRPAPASVRAGILSALAAAPPDPIILRRPELEFPRPLVEEILRSTGLRHIPR